MLSSNKSQIAEAIHLLPELAGSPPADFIGWAGAAALGEFGVGEGVVCGEWGLATRFGC